MKALSVLLLLGLGACKSELQKQHEALGNVMLQPVARMCRIEGDGKEGGGCNGDCPVRRDAQAARGAVIVGERLGDLAPQADPATEAIVLKIREASKLLVAEVGPACTEKVDTDAPPTPGVRACAAAWHEKRARYTELRTHVNALAEAVRAQSGSEIPASPGSCRALESITLR